MQATISELRTGYVDEDNYLHLDAYFTEDENEEGRTIAIIDMDNGKVFFIDNLVKEAITEARRQIPMFSKEEISEIIDESKKPFVHLTIKGRENYENFHAGVPNGFFREPDDEYLDGGEDDMYRFEDIDLCADLPSVLRALGRMKTGSYFFTTEEGG